MATTCIIASPVRCARVIASSSLLSKVLADFLSAIYLLNQVLKHKTNLIQSHCG